LKNQSDEARLIRVQTECVAVLSKLGDVSGEDREKECSSEPTRDGTPPFHSDENNSKANFHET
jgi:hypothetical protein